MGIYIGRGQVSGYVGGYLYSLRRRVFLHPAGDQLGDGYPLPVSRPDAGEVQQIGDDPIRVVHLGGDHVQVLFGGVVGVGVDHLQVVDGIGDDTQRVPQLVAHPAGQLAQYRQFLPTHQLLLGVPKFPGALIHHLLQPLGVFLQLLFRPHPLGDITADARYPDNISRGVPQRCFGGRDP